MKVGTLSQVSWHTPIIPALGRLRQDDCHFQPSMGYIISLKTTWATYWAPVSKKPGLEIQLHNKTAWLADGRVSIWSPIWQKKKEKEESECSCLVPDFRKLSAFLHSECQQLVYYKWPLIICWNVFLYNLVQHFYHERMLNFIKCLFCICWDDHMVFVLYSVDVIYIYWSVYIEQSFNPWDKSRFIKVIILLNVLLDTVC
jgi:hypothetical protein